MKKGQWKKVLSLVLAFMIMFTGFAIMPETISAATKAPTKITLNAKTKTIDTGKSFKLQVKSVTPKKADKSVKYTTSNKKIATVSSKGVVKALKPGKVTITVTSKKNKKVKATCKVTVRQLVKSVKIKNGNQLYLQKGKTLKLKTSVAPSNASKKTVTYKTSNKKVATVDKKGKVTAKKAGTATITVTAADGSKKKATTKVTVFDTKIKKATVTPAKATLYVGKSVQLKTKVTSPKKGAVNAFTWKSSNTKVATVDAKGKVTAKKAGTATITGTAADGSKVKVTSKITVKQYVTSVKLTDTSVTIGEKVTVKATVAPSNASNKSLTWKTSDASIATVDGSGVVTGVKAGTVTITATAKDGSKKSGSCKVTVNPILVSSVSVDKTTADLKVGDSVKLTAAVAPANATNKNVTWSSDNAKVATVDNAGTVKAVAEGTAHIVVTATDGSGKAAICTVKVTKKIVDVTKVTLDQTAVEIKANETVTLTATVAPSDATDKTVTWTSSDTTVATVANGVVTPVAGGETTITAKAGKVTATCVVTVIAEKDALAETDYTYNYSIDKSAVGYSVSYNDTTETMTNEELTSDFEDIMDAWALYGDTTKSLEEIWNSDATDKAMAELEKLNAYKLADKYGDVQIAENEDGTKTIEAVKEDGSKEVKANIAFAANEDGSADITVTRLGENEKAVTISNLTRTVENGVTTLTAEVEGKAVKAVINEDASKINVYRVNGATDVAAFTYESNDNEYSAEINKTYYTELLDILGTTRTITDVTIMNQYK